ncbi:glycoside hydrolase family 43 protein [Ilyonectria robusta]
MKLRLTYYLAIIGVTATQSISAINSTYTNPILPGWHSDPSCVFVPERDNTTFCTTSSFTVFPGLPIYASNDLLNWKLASNAFNRPSQAPGIIDAPRQRDGFFAATLRHHDGVFFLVVSFSWGYPPQRILTNYIFSSRDPYRDDAWSDPITFPVTSIDPDIFWDDDGQAYVTYPGGPEVGIFQATLDPTTGDIGPAYKLWSGSGRPYPEGPHMYRKDGYYYLSIAEGGTELGHLQSMARSTAISGPYESYPANPILTNRNTTEYFQAVGHADLFQDASQNWWGVALSTRSGPTWDKFPDITNDSVLYRPNSTYPMGRETVLFPVTWRQGEWPIMEPVRGLMTGWPIFPSAKKLPGDGAFVNEPDVLDFEPGSKLPSHLVHWRAPDPASYVISPSGHPNTLRLKCSKANLTASSGFDPRDGLTLIMRRQTTTLFTYSVDIAFSPRALEEETGVTIFLTQFQHIDLGIVLLKTGGHLIPHFRLRTINETATVPGTVIRQVPRDWLHQPIRLQIQAVNETHYAFTAMSSSNPSHGLPMGYGLAHFVSGGTGRYTGTSLPVSATSRDLIQSC